MRQNYVKLFLINFIYLLLMEIVFKSLVINTNDLGYFYVVIFTLPVSAIITYFMSLFKSRKVNKIMAIFIYFLILFIFGAETIYYSFYKTICGLSAIMYGGQVMEFAGSIMSHIIANSEILALYISLTIIPILVTIIKTKYHVKHNYKLTITLFMMAFLVLLTSLELNIKNITSAKQLYFQTNDLMESTSEFGVINSVFLDSIKTLTKFEEVFEVSSKLPFSMKEETEYNITNIDFKDLANKTDDSVIQNMHKYFESEEPTNKNDYTGLFAGKNLIFIVAEGFSPIAVDEKVTPTLYKLVNSSFVFDNYYQPIYNCSTSDGEFINQLSILPGVQTCSMKATIGKSLPYSLGNILDNYGYSTYGFHGWTYSYYNRDQTMPNLGYTYYGYDRYKKGYKYALKDIHDSWPTSDIDVINSSYPIYNKDKPFMAYYMSISGHLEYNFSGGNYISKKNKSVVEGMNANTNIKAYVASQVEFDKSLNILLEKLESDGILEDTVIVISADHYPYGLTNADIKSYAPWVKNENFDLYKNNLVIYNSGINSKHITKYTSSLDLLPTVLNLFGLKYDSRLLIGRDIFSDAKDLVIFNNKSWITNRGRYDYLKKKYEPFDGKQDNQYVNEINNIVKQKFQMSKLIISKDYYRSLGG